MSRLPSALVTWTEAVGEIAILFAKAGIIYGAYRLYEWARRGIVRWGERRS